MGEVICQANASHYGAIGAKIRWQRAREAKAAAELAAKTAAIPQPVAEPIADDYSLDRLTRVRKQLDRIDELMLEEIDPAKLDRLASAQARLSEQERILAGRPLPGSLRPAAERRRPIMPALPAPVQETPSVPQAPTNSVPSPCVVPQTPQEPKPQ